MGWRENEMKKRKKYSLLLKIVALLSILGSVVGMFTQRNILTGEIMWELALGYLGTGLFQAVLIYTIALLLDGQNEIISDLEQLKKQEKVQIAPVGIVQTTPELLSPSVKSDSQGDGSIIVLPLKEEYNYLHAGEKVLLVKDDDGRIKILKGTLFIDYLPLDEAFDAIAQRLKDGTSYEGTVSMVNKAEKYIKIHMAFFPGAIKG